MDTITIFTSVVYHQVQVVVDSFTKLNILIQTIFSTKVL